MSTLRESELAGLLQDLSAAQSELLVLLHEKRNLLLAPNQSGFDALQIREQDLIARLQACHDRRAALLERAAAEGLPNDSIRSLAQALPGAPSDALNTQIREASARARLLQHQSLANWVVVQRMLIHLSQVLEIIATGGRSQPTYNNGDAGPRQAGGSLVDQAA